MAWSTIQTARKAHKTLKALERGDFSSYEARIGDIHKYATAKGKQRDLRIAAMAYLIGIPTRQTQIVNDSADDFAALDQITRRGLELCTHLPEDCQPSFALGLQCCRVLNLAAVGNFNEQSSVLADIMSLWPRLGTLLTQSEHLRDADINTTMPILEALERGIVGSLLAGRTEPAQFLQNCIDQLAHDKAPPPLEALLQAKALNVALMSGDSGEVQRLVSALDRRDQLHPDLIQLGDIPAQREPNSPGGVSDAEEIMRFVVTLERYQAKAWLAAERGDDNTARNLWRHIAEDSQRIPEMVTAGVPQGLGIQEAFFAARVGDFTAVDAFTSNYVMPEVAEKNQEALQRNLTCLQLLSSHRQQRFDEAYTRSVELASQEISTDPPFTSELESYAYAAWHLAVAATPQSDRVAAMASHVAGRMRSVASPRGREQAFAREMPHLVQVRDWVLCAAMQLSAVPDARDTARLLMIEMLCSWRDMWCRSAVAGACGPDLPRTQPFAALDQVFLTGCQRVIGASMSGLGPASTQNAAELYRGHFQFLRQQCDDVWPGSSVVLGQHRLEPTRTPAPTPKGGGHLLIEQVCVPEPGVLLMKTTPQGSSTCQFHVAADATAAVPQALAEVAGSAQELTVTAEPQYWPPLLAQFSQSGAPLCRFAPFLSRNVPTQATSAPVKPLAIIEQSGALRSAKDVLARAQGQVSAPSMVMLPAVLALDPAIDLKGIVAAYAVQGVRQLGCLLGPVDESAAVAVANSVNGCQDLATALHQLRTSSAPLAVAAQSIVVIEI